MGRRGGAVTATIGIALLTAAWIGTLPQFEGSVDADGQNVIFVLKLGDC